MPPAKVFEGPAAKEAKKAEAVGAQSKKIPKVAAEKVPWISTIKSASGGGEGTQGERYLSLWLFISYRQGRFG